MIYLLAPHELPEVQLELPSPELGDTSNLEAELDIRNSMNGTLYSYVKNSETEAINYDIKLYYSKYQELREFVIRYGSRNIRLTDMRDRTYVVNLINLPLNFSTLGRDEFKIVRLQFEGKRIS